MSRLKGDGTAEPVSRDQILSTGRGQGNIHFPCSADHEQDWHLYPIDPYSCYMCDNTYYRVKFSRVGNHCAECEKQQSYYNKHIFLYHCRFLFIWRVRRTFFFLPDDVFLHFDHWLDLLHQLMRDFNQSINQSSQVEICIFNTYNSRSLR